MNGRAVCMALTCGVIRSAMHVKRERLCLQEADGDGENRGENPAHVPSLLNMYRFVNGPRPVGTIVLLVLFLVRRQRH